MINQQSHKRILEWALLLGVLIFFLWGFAAQHQQQSLANKVIRLHVLANSDSTEDQALKLRVRDQILAQATELLAQSDTRTDAVERLQTALPDLEDTAVTVLRDADCSFPVRVRLEETVFPTRAYDGFRLPAGTYLALRVIIGNGAGHNWWCVVFPPLCTAVSTDAASTAMADGFSEEDWKLVTESDEGYVLKFKSVELWESLKKKLSGQSDKNA